MNVRLLSSVLVVTVLTVVLIFTFINQNFCKPL
jgi:hypothetical protein